MTVWAAPGPRNCCASARHGATAAAAALCASHDQGVASQPAQHVSLAIPENDDTGGSKLADEDRAADLAESLLVRPVAKDDGRGRYAYPLWGKVLVTAMILFHATILLVWALPGKGLAKGTHDFFNKKFEMSKYLRATGTRQSWAMFAPNPNRTNIFVRVLVEDETGELWDMGHDIRGRRSYPYLWYDRRGKVNRRLARTAGYRRHYAAWVCRQWELERERAPEGEARPPAKEVRFTKLSTRIPPPKKLWRMTKGRPWRGYDPTTLEVKSKDEGSFSCKTTPHAQLPNYLRKRYGLEPLEESRFRKIRIRTWHDQKEQAARKAEREEQRKARDAERAAKAAEREDAQAAAPVEDDADEPDAVF